MAWKETKKSTISLKGIKKVMLAIKQIFTVYPSESSTSFQKPHFRCIKDLSLVLDESLSNVRDSSSQKGWNMENVHKL